MDVNCLKKKKIWWEEIAVRGTRDGGASLGSESQAFCCPAAADPRDAKELALARASMHAHYYATYIHTYIHYIQFSPHTPQALWIPQALELFSSKKNKPAIHKNGRRHPTGKQFWLAPCPWKISLRYECTQAGTSFSWRRRQAHILNLGYGNLYLRELALTELKGMSEGEAIQWTLDTYCEYSVDAGTREATHDHYAPGLRLAIGI